MILLFFFFDYHFLQNSTFLFTVFGFRLVSSASFFFYNKFSIGIVLNYLNINIKLFKRNIIKQYSLIFSVILKLFLMNDFSGFSVTLIYRIKHCAERDGIEFEIGIFVFTGFPILLLVRTSSIGSTNLRVKHVIRYFINRYTRFGAHKQKILSIRLRRNLVSARTYNTL